jgi:DNA end-binding protein Ku
MVGSGKNLRQVGCCRNITYIMMARAIGTGSISFGLVAIPVKLYPATQASSAISFNLLHKGCGSRLKQQYLCNKEGTVVAREDMVKGYEFAKDQYVTFTPEELKALEERGTGAIDIQEFVPLAAIDPVYFDKPYYLGPEKGGDKAYHLLAQVMRSTGRCALARYAARGKMYLVIIRPAEQGLVLQQLMYADEVRAWSEVPLPDVPAIRDNELKLAEQLVAQISVETFEPTKYEDEVKKRIVADIDRKVAGQEISSSESEGSPAQIIDLMEALKASLDAQQARAGKADAQEPERKPAHRAPGAEAAEADAEPRVAKARGRKR